MRLGGTAVVVCTVLVLAACGQGAAVKTVIKTVEIHSAAGTVEIHSAAGTCKDVTSYDYNWNNDMLCKRQDGSTFETDYAGAVAFEAKHSK